MGQKFHFFYIAILLILSLGATIANAADADNDAKDFKFLRKNHIVAHDEEWLSNHPDQESLDGETVPRIHYMKEGEGIEHVYIRYIDYFEKFEKRLNQLDIIDGKFSESYFTMLDKVDHFKESGRFPLRTILSIANLGFIMPTLSYTRLWLRVATNGVHFPVYIPYIIQLHRYEKSLQLLLQIDGERDAEYNNARSRIKIRELVIRHNLLLLEEKMNDLTIEKKIEKLQELQIGLHRILEERESLTKEGKAKVREAIKKNEEAIARYSLLDEERKKVQARADQYRRDFAIFLESEGAKRLQKLGDIVLNELPLSAKDKRKVDRRKVGNIFLAHTEIQQGTKLCSYRQIKREYKRLAKAFVKAIKEKKNGDFSFLFHDRLLEQNKN